jgi:hypothetical protein
VDCGNGSWSDAGSLRVGAPAHVNSNFSELDFRRGAGALIVPRQRLDVIVWLAKLGAIEQIKNSDLN